MEQQTNFLEPPPPEWLSQMRERIRAWSQRGVYFGGSSWKYPGWLGQIYTRDRYLNAAGRFSETNFKNQCLTEYAKWFPTVCGDFTFYEFYSTDFWSKLFEQVPASFQFGFKIPERITCPVFPHHPRYGTAAGSANDHFLDAELLTTQFLDRLAPYQKQIGYLVFQFPEFHRNQSENFIGQLDLFLGQLPRTLRYSVELRTEELLGTEYFKVLSKHGVAHVFNSWTRMPSVGEQLKIPAAMTGDFTVARLLLKPGRTYEQAVKAFQPYSEIRDPYPEGYRDAADVVRAARQSKRAAFIAINNRFAGNTIRATNEILNALEKI